MVHGPWFPWLNGNQMVTVTCDCEQSSRPSRFLTGSACSAHMIDHKIGVNANSNCVTSVNHVTERKNFYIFYKAAWLCPADNAYIRASRSPDLVVKSYATGWYLSHHGLPTPSSYTTLFSVGGEICQQIYINCSNRILVSAVGLLLGELRVEI